MQEIWSIITSPLVMICPSVRFLVVVCQNAFMHMEISAQKVQKKVRITLKAIESLSYNCCDGDKLQMLHELLKNAEDKFRSLLPHQGGLLLRPTLMTHTTTAARKVSLKYRRL